VFLFVCKPDAIFIFKTGSVSWVNRQKRDVFVKQAKIDNWRCRSAFKLIELDDKFHIFKAGDVVIDCGAAPGSWTQVAVQRVNALGKG
jgi:23S rRNA (uridine2552-2'-O)-methyltransferase